MSSMEVYFFYPFAFGVLSKCVILARSRICRVYDAGSAVFSVS